MKQVRIAPNYIGLVYRNSKYLRALGEGVYWFWSNVDVYVYSRSNYIDAPVDVLQWLQDESLAASFEMKNVADGELLLVFENGLFKAVLRPGRYIFWKGVVDYAFLQVNTEDMAIPEAVNRTLRQHPLLEPFVRKAEVQPHEKALLFVDGQYSGLLGPGSYTWWKNAIPLQLVRVDLRQQQLEINGQEILTRDKASLRLNAWAQYAVRDAETAVLRNKDYERQLYIQVQLALRAFVGGYTLDELLEKKGELEPFVIGRLNEVSGALGVQVESFGIRDVILPGDVKEIMNSVLVAEKKAQATGILRREETASTRSLLNTARLMEDNPMLWKLKQMEYVEKIAEKVGNINLGGQAEVADQLRKLFVP